MTYDLTYIEAIDFCGTLSTDELWDCILKSLLSVRLRYLTLILGVLIACWQDIHYRRISNYLTMPMLVYGLFLAALEGWPVLQDRFWAVLLPFGLLLPLYAMRVFGAGDVKLLMAIGAIMGFEWLLRCLIFTILLGGVLALLLMIVRGVFVARLRYFFSYCKKTLILRQFMPYQSWKTEEKMWGKQFFPFAVAIALGSLATFVSYKFY